MGRGRTGNRILWNMEPSFSSLNKSIGSTVMRHLMIGNAPLGDVFVVQTTQGALTQT